MRSRLLQGPLLEGEGLPGRHLHATTCETAAAEGKLDSIAVSDLGNLTRELFSAQKAFNEATDELRTVLPSVADEKFNTQ